MSGLLISGSYDLTLRLWRPIDGACLQVLTLTLTLTLTHTLTLTPTPTLTPTLTLTLAPTLTHTKVGMAFRAVNAAGVPPGCCYSHASKSMLFNR